MQTAEVIIIGGGPAGSSCAWRLRQQGVDTLLLDAQAFPRLKLCAGWITPAVVHDLQLDISSYPRRFNSFNHLVVHLFGFTFNLNSLQHSIRRFEFDEWLLQRSGVPVLQHNVREIVKENNYYVLDGQYRARYLIGAGGTKCPVYRSFFRELNPRARELQTVTLEHEYAYEYTDPRCHLWFFKNKLPGYAWYVPKAQGYLNIGLGGMALTLKQRADDIWRHWDWFIKELQRKRLIGDFDAQPKGYSYYLRQAIDTVRIDNAFIIGDAVGLATVDMAEGIGPAVRSGLRAAAAITQGHAYSIKTLETYTITKPWAHWWLDKILAR
ncbi:MAG: NAD(P)/FAD-dependent oxidoreductase [Gammaproteobacteria bacterium]|nr:NAD(P)/FAD-dependent oxidoreductase [Gammaproteobacteria bacterium]